jgi:hypothetical protein
MNDTIIQCANCSDDIDTENDVFYGSEHNGETYCQSCHHEDLNNASIITLFGPDYERQTEGPVRIFVGNWFVEDCWADPYSELDVQRTYIRTNGWRGYHETRISGWTEVLSGWTTGGWGDPTSDRKQPFNVWAQDLFDGTYVPPVNVALITDPTSNVFSTAIGVWVADADVDTFNEWINGELDTLRYALT